MLKQLRKELCLTQESAARKAAVPLAIWCKVERGGRPSQPTAQKIAAALGKKPEMVFPNFDSLRSW
jgi:DNA-binding XRE family transcriptional regulator